MTVDELHKLLLKKEVPNDAYNFKEEYPNESYCIIKKGFFWEVYYSERGNKNELRIFFSESKACKYFIKLIKCSFDIDY